MSLTVYQFNMQIFSDTNVKTSQPPPAAKPIPSPAPVKRASPVEVSPNGHYLIENLTDKGIKGKLTLDNFTGTSQTDLSRAIRGLFQLPDFPLTIEYLDPVMCEYIPLPEMDTCSPDSLASLPQVAVLRFFRADNPPKMH